MGTENAGFCPNSRQKKPLIDSRLGGGLWADRIFRLTVEDRLGALIADEGSLEKAVNSVMKCWRDQLLPAIFEGKVETFGGVDAKLAESVSYRITG